MKPTTTSFLWEGDARWITAVFVAYLIGLIVFVLSDFSKTILAGTNLFSALVCFSGCAAGLHSSRMFGGRKNFTGRLLLLLSISIFFFGLGFIFSIALTFYAANAFLSDSLEAGFVTLFFVLAVFTAAYALIVSAWAVVNRLDRTVISRILLALAIVLVVEFLGNQAEVRLTPGLTILGAFEGDLPYTASFFVLATGALILVAQLGKWYATPGISIIAYGYVILSIVPGLVRALLLLSGIRYVFEIGLFLGTLTVILYLVGLGMKKVRPTLKESPKRQG